MKFVAVRSNRMMSIDNAKVGFDVGARFPAEAASAELVTWNGDAGKGTLEFTNGVRIVRQIDDLEPYVRLIDEWMTFASALASPITLTQARSIKKDTVEALYINKKTRPFPYGGYWYDGTDAAVSDMAGALMLGQEWTGGAPTGPLRDIILEFIRVFNISANAYSQGTAPVLNAWSQLNMTNWHNIQMREVGTRTKFYGIPAPNNIGLAAYPDAHARTETTTFSGNPASVHFHTYNAPMWGIDYINRGITFNFPPYYGYQNMTPYAGDMPSGGGSSGLGGGPIRWTPYQSSGQVDINRTDFINALKFMLTRRRNLYRERKIKKDAIDARGSVQDVINYPITVWP